MKLLVFILFFYSEYLYTQIPNFPARNDLNKEIYEILHDQYQVNFDALNDINEDFDYKSRLWGWRLLGNFLKSFPANKGIILELFYDRIKYESVNFCEAYSHNISTMFSSKDTAYTYYKQEFSYMSNICSCILDQQNKDLKKFLIKIKEDDQQLRNKPDFMTDKLSQNKQSVLDSINLIKIENILKIYGYPNRSLVGTELEDVAFLILQHSNEEKIEKYLPLIKQQVENRNLKSKTYAYLFDRLKMFKNLPQKYGTQFMGQDIKGNPILYKCEDLNNLNLRRYRMNLTMLDNYPKPIIENERVVENKK